MKFGDFGGVINVAETTLRDVRDNNSYIVRKLADGNCWMTSNLKIAGQTLTSATSNVSSNFALPSPIPISSWVDSYDTPYLTNGGTNNSYLYNYYAASAGAVGNTNVNIPEQVTTDICPKNWQLPRGDTAKGSWYYLTTTTLGLEDKWVCDDHTINRTVLDAFPYNFIATGDANGYTGANGTAYWSNRPQAGSLGAYRLAIVGRGDEIDGCLQTNAGTGYYTRSHGMAIRCIAK